MYLETGFFFSQKMGMFLETGFFFQKWNHLFKASEMEIIALRHDMIRYETRNLLHHLGVQLTSAICSAILNNLFPHAYRVGCTPR